MEWNAGWFGIVIAALILGAVAGFFISRWLFQRELEKNPPISEKMIRTMYAQMGQKPSEAKIRQIMNSVRNSK